MPARPQGLAQLSSAKIKRCEYVATPESDSWPGLPHADAQLSLAC